MGLADKFLTAFIQSMTVEELKHCMSPEQLKELAPKLTNEQVIQHVNTQFTDEENNWDDLYRRLCDILQGTHPDWFARWSNIDDVCRFHGISEVFDVLMGIDEDTVIDRLMDQSPKDLLFDVFEYSLDTVVEACVEDSGTEEVLAYLDHDEVQVWASQFNSICSDIASEVNKRDSSLWLVEELRVSDYPRALEFLANCIIHKVTEPKRVTAK